MSECEHLGSKLGVGPNADQAGVCEKARKRVGKAEEHGGGSCRSGHGARGTLTTRDLRRLRFRQLRSRLVELTGKGLWHTPDRERYMTEEGKYQLLTLCWTSAGQRRPAIVERRSLVVTPQLKQSLDARIGGKPPAGFPELPPGRSYNTDLVFVAQKLPNDELTEVDVDEWIGRGSVGSVG